MSRYPGTVLVLGLVAGLGCVEQGADRPAADPELIGRNVSTTAPHPQFPVNASLGDGIVYLGVDITPTPVEPGKSVKLVHYWQVEAPPGKDWRTFTHVQGPARVGYFNVDHQPVQGQYPVGQWKAGDFVRDEHSFALPAGWSQPSLEVYVGLWRGPERMPIKSGAHDQEGRVLAARVPVKAATPPLLARRYLVHRAPRPIKLDGVLDEAAWKSAPTTGPFLAARTGGPGEVKTEARLLWDDKNLYVALENADPDVWADGKGRDGKLLAADAVMVLLDAVGKGTSYIELQAAPNRALADAYLPGPHRYEDTLGPRRKPFDWTSGLQVAVKVDGTLARREDQDRGWTVELALPLRDAAGEASGAPKTPPALGDTWRLNLLRFDASRGREPAVVAWAPPLGPDPHAPDRFGQIVFVDERGMVPLSMPAGSNPEMEARLRAAHGAWLGGMQAPARSPGAGAKPAAKR
jgi:hypothetical protein